MASDAPAPRDMRNKSGPSAPQKHISGLLVTSVLLSFGGFIFLPLILPAIGLVLAFTGKKKVRQNPLLVGPRFAMAAIWIAVIALPLQGWMAYMFWPSQALGGEVNKRVMSFFSKVEGRDAQGTYDVMSKEYRDTHSVADVEAALGAAFPGKGPIDIPAKNGLEIDSASPEMKQAGKDQQKLLRSHHETVTTRLPILAHPKSGPSVSVVLTVRITRAGYSNFKVDLLDFAMHPVPHKKSAPAKAPAETEKAGKGAGKGAQTGVTPPATGTGSAGAKKPDSKSKPHPR